MSRSLLDAFEAGVLEPAAFDHAAHVRVAAALLAEADFLEAVGRYMAGVRALATKAGAPTKANLTITLAFLPLVAERRARGESEAQIAAALSDPTVLKTWYRPGRLADPLARTVFLMPDQYGRSSAGS